MHSKEINIPSFILEDITSVISVVYLILSFFWDITQKRVHFQIFLKNKFELYLYICRYLAAKPAQGYP